jgi:ferredoxin
MMIMSDGKKKFKIVFNREACIGAFYCMSADPKNWKQAPHDNRKVDLAGASENKEAKVWVKAVDEGELKKEAEERCPVQAIQIVEISEEEYNELKAKLPAQPGHKAAA